MSLTDLIMAMTGKTVLIVGDVMLDTTIWGSARRISPEAPVPVIEIERQTANPGGAANVAANVSALGGRTLLAGVTGQDHPRRQLLDLLAEQKVETAGLLPCEDRPTTAKTRIVAQNQQITRLDSESRQPLTSADQARLLDWIMLAIPSADVLLISDYAKGVVSETLAQACIQAARRAGKPALVDPKSRDFSRYQGASVITPNLKEVSEAANLEIESEEQLQIAARRLLDQLPGSALLVTRSQAGMSLFLDSRPALNIPAQARQVYDVTGAGDTAISALALALAAGADLLQAAQLANLAAGIAVGKLGAGS